MIVVQFSHTFSLKLNSSIDISKLKKVVSQWINKNSILHFNYNNDNKFYQQKNSQISDYNTIEELYQKPFQLELDPLFRININNDYLIGCFHHIILDEFSIKLMMEQIIDLYNGNSKEYNDQIELYQQFCLQDNKSAKEVNHYLESFPDKFHWIQQK